MKVSSFFVLWPLLLVSCDKPKSGASADPRFEILNEEISELRAEVEHQKRLRAVEVQQLIQMVKAVEKYPAEPIVQRELAMSQVLPVEKVTPVVRGVSELRLSARQKAVGESLSELVSSSGRSFREVTISRVSDVGLEIIHSHGTARVRFDDLGSSWQERFFFDAAAAEQILKEESLAALREEKRQRKVFLARQKLVEAQQEEAQVEARIRKDHERALALAEASRPIEIHTTRQNIHLNH